MERVSASPKSVAKFQDAECTEELWYMCMGGPSLPSQVQGGKMERREWDIETKAQSQNGNRR